MDAESAREGVPPDPGIGDVRMSLATIEAMQMREESQRRGMLAVKRSIAKAQAGGESFAAFKAHYRPVGIDGKLKDLWAEVAEQTRIDAVASALITKETGVDDVDRLQQAAAARASPVWERSDRNGGSPTCRWCDTGFGLTVWRYNCSACGWKVCGECSSNTLELTRWLDAEKPHELRNVASGVALCVCKGCWYAAQAVAATTSAGTSVATALSGSNDTSVVVKALLMGEGGVAALRATLSALPREDLLLLARTTAEAAAAAAAAGSEAAVADHVAGPGDGETAAEFLAEVVVGLAGSVEGARGTIDSQLSLRESVLSLEQQPLHEQDEEEETEEEVEEEQDNGLDHVGGEGLSRRVEALSPGGAEDGGAHGGKRRRQRRDRGRFGCCGNPRGRDEQVGAAGSRRRAGGAGDVDSGAVSSGDAGELQERVTEQRSPLQLQSQPQSQQQQSDDATEESDVATRAITAFQPEPELRMAEGAELEAQRMSEADVVATDTKHEEHEPWYVAEETVDCSSLLCVIQTQMPFSAECGFTGRLNVPLVLCRHADELAVRVVILSRLQQRPGWTVEDCAALDSTLMLMAIRGYHHEAQRVETTYATHSHTLSGHMNVRTFNCSDSHRAPLDNYRVQTISDSHRLLSSVFRYEKYASMIDWRREIGADALLRAPPTHIIQRHTEWRQHWHMDVYGEDAAGHPIMGHRLGQISPSGLLSSFDLGANVRTIQANHMLSRVSTLS